MALAPEIVDMMAAFVLLLQVKKIMALFPTSPSNGDQTTVNGITYVYASSSQSWTRVATYAWALGNGTSSLTFGTSGGNANISIGGTSNVLVVANTSTNFAGNLLPTSNVTYSLGSTTNRWKDLYLANSTIYLGNGTISSNATAMTISGVNALAAMAIEGVLSGRRQVCQRLGSNCLCVFYCRGICRCHPPPKPFDDSFNSSCS